MNAAQVHLMLNHVPVIGVLFAALALAVGLVWRSGAILRLGLATLVLAGLAAVPVFFSGEPAEETVEHLAGVTESSIESHEGMAKAALVGMGGLALLALTVLVRSQRREPSRGLAGAVLVLAVVMAGVFAWTAHLGGAIRHPELAGSSTVAGEADTGAADEDDRD